MINTYSNHSKNRIITPYGTIIFGVIYSKNGYEVAIKLFNNGLDAGDYGYGFYAKKGEALKEMQVDIKKLVDDQIDADHLFNIVEHPSYIKSIPYEISEDNPLLKSFMRSSRE